MGLRERISPSVRRQVRQVRHPNIQTWYGWHDPRSWSVAAAVAGRFRPGRAEVRASVQVLRRGRRGGRVLASVPRSGAHWMQTMLNSAYDLGRGGDGEYRYVPGFRISGDPAWIPTGQRLCWSTPTASLVQLVQTDASKGVPDAPVLVSHQPAGPPHARTDVPGARPVILVRDPTAVLTSWVRMRGFDLSAAPGGEVPITATARRLAGWYDHWAAATRAPDGGRILVVRYEDLRADPAAVLARVCGHWNLGFTDGAIERSVHLCRREAMAAKTGFDEANVRVTVGAPPVDRAALDLLVETFNGAVGDTMGYPAATSAASR